MEALLTDLLAWVRANPVWTGVLVFAVSLAESLAIVGIVVPGVVIMFGIGALIAAGAADFWTICAWAVAGAVMGDTLSYWLGRRYKEHLREIWPFTRHPGMLDQGERFFAKYGGISVAFARFFGPVRATVPLVAGMLEMRPAIFLVANIGSALLWAPAYLIPGVVLGASLELASEVAFGLVVLIVTVIALAWFTGWATHRVFKAVQPRARALLERIARLGERVAWLRQIADAIADPTHPEARGLALYATLLILGTTALALVATLVATLTPWPEVEGVVADLMSSLRTPGADRIMAPLALEHPGAFVLVTGAAVALVFLVGRRLPALAHWAAGLAFVGVVIALAAGADHGSGPGILAPNAGVLAMAATAGLLAVLIAPAVPELARWSVYSTGLILVVLTGFARLYFGLATLGGLLIGWLLALTWVAGLGVAYRTHALGRELPGRAALLATAAFAAGIGLHAQRAAPPPLPEAAGEPGVMDVEQWRNGGWQRLPTRREDLLHTWAQPLNLQYAGTLDALDQRLGAAGWERREPAGAGELLRWLSPSLPLERLPLLPHVHDGRHETATWTRMDGERRLVLRLWPAPGKISGERPLWVGAVSEQVKEERFGLLGYAVTTPRFRQATARLREDLGPAGARSEPTLPVLLLP